MRRMKATLRTTAALAVFMTMSLEAGIAKETTPAVTGAVPTKTFSGAYLAGRAAEFDNDLNSAVTYYERALAFDPDNTDLQQTLLLTLISQGDLDKALPFAEKLQAVPEVERFSRLALAVDSFRDKDFPAAERWLNLVLESDLDRLITSIMTSWAKVGQGDVDAALANLDDLDGPDWYELFKGYHHALILAYGGRDEDADAAFEEVVGTLAPRSVAPDTFGRLAEVYASYLSSRGETERALAVLSQAEQSGGGIVTIPELRAKLEAGEKLAPVVKDPSDGAAEILLNIGTELASGGGDAFVRLYLQLGRALRPRSDAILVQLAHVAERQQDGEEAIAIYRQIEDDSPWARFAAFQIGLNLADLKRNEEAIAHLKKVLDADPKDMRAYLALGGVYSSEKNYRAAAELYDRAVEQIAEPAREHWNIFYQRGIAYERLKEWPKAEPNFKTALELYPDHPQVLNYLGYSWIDMNMNLEEGMDLIRKAVELRPSDGYIVDSLGWAYYRLGQYDEAVTQLERAVSLRPEDAVLNDHLGDVYWRVGRRLEARYQWAQVKDLEPEPDLLAQVEEKLENGLPPEDGKKVADAAGTPRVLSEEASAQAAQKPEEPAAKPDTPAAAPEEAPAADAAAANGETYKVKPGQSLWSIAVEELGDGKRFREILDLNPVLKGDPNRIRPGLELTLPAGGR
ncbi:tetratricopeptide repeat protein [Chelativorans sp. AA-79]|uniref:tetratricopeptide repeat protein n=1 Tax=Chelativorans sp. AA-79 TaxID=3028735 RepID=UPI0023FA3038|nr:tetratricopeptide repeat protein [Chelativorans sp. AA-79]WEX08113.1 tetratricopeptide repeat protein [Chelativorans sp. AA-79]